VPRYGPPNEQVRDGTLTTQTTSLEEYGNEPVPDEIIRDLLVDQWLPAEAAPRPLIIVKNDIKQVDMKRSDAVVVSVDHYGAEFVGHRHEFLNIEVPVLIELHTAVSRQRLWNLMAEVRRIILKNILSVRPYQSNYFDGFKPDYEGRAGYYSGTMTLRLTADMLPWYSMVVDGMQSPNSVPDAPEGD
jgi:hypothetical protein